MWPASRLEGREFGIDEERTPTGDTDDDYFEVVSLTMI